MVQVVFPLLVDFFPSLTRPGSTALLYDLADFTGITLCYLFIPLTIGVAVLRYRLWDIDVLINPALVYGALTASVVVLYVLLVGGLGLLLQARGNLPISLLAAGLIAVLFAPMRDRLQRGVNRLMYGERDEPYNVLSRLGQRLEATLEPKSVLPAVAETVAQALKLPYAAIALKEDGAGREGFAVAAAYGSPLRSPIRLPLVYQHETAAQHGQNGLDVSVDASELPPLPAAVEVAVYRIAQEAMTNVARHAAARECSVSLALDKPLDAGVLCLEVRDDGRGLPDPQAGVPSLAQAGVGLHSMCERAAELGGSFTVETLPEGGTVVCAMLSLPEEE